MCETESQFVNIGTTAGFWADAISFRKCVWQCYVAQLLMHALNREKSFHQNLYTSFPVHKIMSTAVPTEIPTDRNSDKPCFGFSGLWRYLKSTLF